MRVEPQGWDRGPCKRPQRAPVPLLPRGQSEKVLAMTQKAALTRHQMCRWLARTPAPTAEKEISAVCKFPG